MKKINTFLAFIVTMLTFAQAPQGFNYQATVRNAAGALIVNQNVNFKFNIMLNSPTSVPVYSETHYVPTDDLGAVNVVIGQGTPTTTGTFAGINWGVGNYYMGIELNTGSGYVAMGTTQLLSVPYALYANSAGNNQNKGKPSIMITGNITNAQASAQIAEQLGIYTENIYVEQTTGLTSLDLSGVTSLANLIIVNNSNLTTINLSGISAIYQTLLVENNNSLNTLSFQALKASPPNWNEFVISNNYALTSISFPILTRINKDIYIANNTNLTSIGMPSLIYVGDGINFYNNALPSSQINAYLNKLVSITDWPGGFTNFNGQTPPAPPTGQGIADKQTLVNLGYSINTD